MFYVNSWGRAKIELLLDRVGAFAPARFLYIKEQDSFSKIVEITHTIGYTFQNLGFVVAAFNPN